MITIKSDDDLKKDIIQEAITFARAFHEIKQPGYFDDHVMAVVREVQKHTTDLFTVLGAIFHDLVEDTDCTLAMIVEKFGFEVARLVDNVTDAEGPNRKTRKIRTYHKIRSDNRSLLIKLSDRLDNLRRCMRDPQVRFASMYVNEDYSFQCALWNPYDYQDIWSEYFQMIEVLKMQMSRYASNA